MSTESKCPDGTCPLCGAPNGCRMESGEAYKGSCWCEAITVSGAAVRRLTADLPAPRCFCRRCMEAIAANPDITAEELQRR